MIDQAFTETTLAKQFTTSDFHRHKSLKIAANKKTTLQKALARSQEGFSVNFNIRWNIINSKRVYSFVDFSDEILMRKVNSNIKTVAFGRHQDRDSIVYNLIQLLKEGVPYRIYKFDIKSFYESLSPTNIIEKLREETFLSRITIRLIESLLTEFKNLQVIGYPRGLSISATLTEVHMKEFDELVREDPNVFFYSRFVDDIILLTSGSEKKEALKSEIAGFLPTGLQFNKKKHFCEEVLRIKMAPAGGTNPCLLDFNYLGYTFKVTNPNDQLKFPKITSRHRYVTVDISDNKVKKIKSRLVLSFISFCKDCNFELLRDRIKLLAGNYSIVDIRKNIKIKTGIYYSYKFVTIDKSIAIPTLDKFLRNMILSCSGSVCSNVYPLLTDLQRKTLLKVTFNNGFRKRVFYHFRPQKLAKVMEAWSYE